jgi:ATP-binding cassette subfamily B protein
LNSLRAKWRHLHAFFNEAWKILNLAWSAQPRLSVSVVLLSLAQALLPVAAAWLFKHLLDAAVLSFEMPGSHKLGDIGWFAAGYALVISLQKAIMPIDQYSKGELQRAIGLLVQGNVYRRTISFDGIAYLEDPKYHDLQSVTSQSVQAAPFIVADGLSALVRSASLLVSFLGLLLVLSPVLAIFVLLAVVPHLLIHLRFGRDRFKLAFDLSPLQREAFYLSNALTMLSIAKELRLFGMQQYLFQKWERVAKQSHGAQSKLQRKELGWQLALEGLAFAGMALAFFFIVQGILHRRMSVGDIALYISALTGVQTGILALVRAVAQTAEARLFFTKYEALQGMPQPIRVAARPQPVVPLRHGLEFNNVWFRYTDDSPWVLKGVSFFVPAGECVALVGANGAGKSTLVKLIARLYDPTEGEILWDGVDIRTFAVSAYRRQLSAVFQDFVQYPLSVWENIGLGDVNQIEQREVIRAAAFRAEIAARIEQLPFGYDTQLSRWLNHGEQGTDLSGGEWQRVAIARSFMRREGLRLLDEPTSALDSETERNIVRLFEALKEGCTTLLISHRFSTVRLADGIVVMEEGQIVERGTHRELMTQASVYHRMYTAQANLFEGSLDGFRPLDTLSPRMPSRSGQPQ